MNSLISFGGGNRPARIVAIIVTLIIWLVVLALAFRTAISSMALVVLFLLGFAPYLLSIHVLEPWIDQRRNRRASE